MWADPSAYDAAYCQLAERFGKNFAQFRPLVRSEVASAGP
jgi:hypothetical protein